MPVSKPYHSLNADKIYKELQTSINGLSSQEAEARLQQYGKNKLRTTRKKSALKRFLLQFNSSIIYVLLVAAAITIAIGHITDSFVIIGVVLINAVIGFIQEGKAEESLAALRQMLSLHTRIIRDSTVQLINAELIVPGDIILVEAGDKIPADMRLITCHNLEIQESVLTGESQSITKDDNATSPDTPLAERKSMAYAGTYVTKGQGKGIVTSTADNTEIGHIGSLLQKIDDTTTPLMRRMDSLGRALSVIILSFSFLIFLFGVLIRGFGYPEMFMAVIGIAVAAIPEGLPAIVTITLAIGVQRMARRKAIIRKLPAAESLGAIDVICTDKTGTLTRNELSVRHVVTANGLFGVSGAGYKPEGEFTLKDTVVTPSDHPTLCEIGVAALLNNDAELNPAEEGYQVTGDPTEGALLAFALKAGHSKANLQQKLPRKDFIPFDASYSLMATLHHNEAGEGIIYIKGAPEKLLTMCDMELCDNGKTVPVKTDYWRDQTELLAMKGERVLAIGYIDKHKGEKLHFSHLESGMVLLGLIGIADSPRVEAKQSIATCYKAGIAVKMITGDHAVTASAIGKELGIKNYESVLTGKDLEELSDAELVQKVSDINIYARTTPKHKLRLISALQNKGHIVAMTGDGVNDAPALKKADIGVAMGKNGAEVAKEAAAIVLIDDNFTTITHAIEEGRTIFNNVRKSIAFILATSFAEAGVIILAILIGLAALPISPVQILWVNMITAVTLSLSLSLEPANQDIMAFKPRKSSDPFFSKAMTIQSIFVTIIATIGTLGIFLWEINSGTNINTAQTITVNTLVMFEAFYLLTIRYSKNFAISRGAIISNPYVVLSIITVMLFQIAFTYFGFMQGLFGTASITMFDWLKIILVSSSLFFAIEGKKALMRITR